MKPWTRKTPAVQAACLMMTFCLTFGLAGCGAQTPKDSQPTASGAETAEPAGGASQTPDTAQGEIRILTSGLLHASAGEEGFYLPQVAGDVVLGTVVDFVTGEQRVLCDIPGCTHDSPDCGAWLRSAGELGDQAADSCALLRDGDTLLWLVFDDPVTEGESYADLSAPDGSGRTRLADSLPALCPSWSNWPNGFFSDGESWYFLTSRDGSDAFLSRLDPDTGVLTTTELEGGSPGTLIGTDGGSVLFWQERPDGSRQLLALDPAAARVEARDSWLSGSEVLVAAARDGTLYGVVRQGENLLLQAGPADADPGTIAELPASPDGARAVAASLTGPFEDTLMVDLHFPNADDGASTPALRCGVELDTGACHTLEATWQTDNSPEPPLLLAAGEDTLWLAVSHSPTESVTVDPAGTPSRQETSTAQTALARAADYLTGSGETRPVTTLTGKFTAHIPH